MKKTEVSLGYTCDGELILIFPTIKKVTGNG